MSTTSLPFAVSFVVPVYNEEGNVERVHADITRAGAALGRPYEIIFVNDGSRDGTLARLESLVARDRHLTVIDFDGNFGEAAALSAGFNAARGELVCALDGDGQNDPGDLPKLLAALGPGRDVVTGFRSRREGSFFTRVLPSRVANALIARITGVPIHDCGCSLKLYRRSLFDDVQLPHGFHRFLPAILGVRAEQVVEVEVNDRPRGSGQSHYGLSRIFIVLRDLAGLRLVLRRRPRRATARALRLGSIAVAAGSLAAVASGHPLLGVLGLLGAVVLGAAWYDVIRMVVAREQGAYRVGRVLRGAEQADAAAGAGAGSAVHSAGALPGGA